MKLKLKPFHDLIVVKRAQAEERKTAGGLHLPKSSKMVPDTAVVEAVGPGRVLDTGEVLKPGVKIGDVVVINRHSGSDVNWRVDENETRTVISFQDILGILEESDEGSGESKE